MNGGPFNVSIRNLQREFALTGKIPPYAAPAAFGRFEVLHQVGAGVLGPVFLARDPERSRSVAVKVFRLDLTPEQSAELVSQLGLLARANLAHPSIIAPFEAGLDGSTAFMAEEYVAADSLDSAIRQYGPAPVAHGIRILAAVAGALDFAAAAGVYHGALHPRDLLVTPDDTRVTGLGIGRALEAVGLRAPMRRPYVAPERVQREGWDARADIYSLGVLARELVFGRQKADDSQARLPDEQAERLQSVLARATAARPADRFSTCLELLAAVQDAVADKSSLAAAARARHRATHDLLLPLEGESPAAPAEEQEAATPRMTLEEPDAVPELPVPVETAAAVTPLPDLDLRAAHSAEPAPDAFDLPDFDTATAPEVIGTPPGQLEGEAVAEPAMLDGGTGMSLAGPRTAELGEPIELPQPEAEEPYPFADVLEAAPAEPADEPAADTIAEAIADEPPIAASATPAPAVLAVDAPLDRSGGSGWRALPLAAMLVAGIAIGVIVMYLIGAGGRTDTTLVTTPQTQTVEATPPAAAPAGQAAALPAPPSTTPAAQPPAGAANTAAAKAAAPKGAAPATVRGVLYVRSTPKGATVALNGKTRGVTPLRIRNLAAGRYTVRVSRRGYTSEERDVVVSAARPTPTVAVSLKTASAARAASRTEFFGTLSVESLPSGARVFVDGTLVGTTPLASARVAAGSHVVRVDRVGFRPWTSPIQVVTDQNLRVTASLEREGK